MYDLNFFFKFWTAPKNWYVSCKPTCGFSRRSELFDQFSPQDFHAGAVNARHQTHIKH